MENAIRFVWIGVNAAIQVWLFLLIIWLLIPFVNGNLVPDDYNAAFYPGGTAEIVTRVVLYGVALVEWTAFVALLFLINRLLFRSKFAANKIVLLIGGICGVSILLLLAIFAR